MLTIKSKILIFYYDDKINFRDIRKIQIVIAIFMWYYVFITSNFIYIQAFLHCSFTGNETNGCVCLDIGVPGSLLRIHAWTKFHHPCPLSYYGTWYT